MNKIKLSILTIFFMSIFNGGLISQISVSYYNGELSKFGISKKISKKIRAEIKLYTIGDYYEDLTPEIILTYELISKANYNIYFGFGASYNLINDLIFPIGVQFYPIPIAKQFSIHFELQPSYDYDCRCYEYGNNDYILRGYWGMRYDF